MADVNDLVATARQRERDGAWQEAAALWLDCIWRWPADEAVAAWLAGYGRALLTAGETVRAIAVLKRAATLHPDQPDCISGLAQAYARSEAHDRAAGVWMELLTRFTDHPDRRWWLPSAAYSHVELGHLDAAEDLCRRAISDFPHAPGGHAMLSVVAERRFRWREALACVERALELCSSSERAALVVSKARILGEMGAIADCGVILQEACADLPDAPALCAAAARLAELQGPVVAAQQVWDECLARFPDDTPAWAGKAALLRFTGRAEEAEVLLRQACERWPAHAALRRMLAETLAQRREVAAARREWAEARRLAPFSMFRLWAQCAFLGSCGAREEAEALLSSASASHRVLWRGRFEYAKAARELDMALECLAELRSASPEEAVLAYAEAEIRSWRQDDGDLVAAAEILRTVIDPSVPSVRAAELLVRVLVLQGEAAGAGDVLSSIPGEDRRRGVSEARVWNDVRRGAWPAAREEWDRLARNVFMPALHLPSPDLRLLAGSTEGLGNAAILGMTMVRNELPRLPAFLSHHRALGVDGFVIIDNGSQDGTTDFLRAQPDVILYGTEESYAQSHFGIRWLNHVIDLHGHGWVLYADADERLVFPGSEQRGLGDFTGYLSARGEQVVPGVMIDMFPQRTGGKRPAEHQWFDPLHIRPSIICPYIEASGGARRRLFGTTVALNKAPLVNAGAGVRYLNSHTTTPAPVSGVTAALLHYHLDYLFDAENVARLEDEIARGEHSDFAVDRRRSLATMQRLAGGDLRGENSQKYSGSAQLLQLGQIRTTETFAEISG